MAVREDSTNAPPSKTGNRAWAVAGIAIAVLVVLGLVALASRSWTHPTTMMSTDQQVASAWTQQNPQMWAWMGTHWDEMTLMHQHWGDQSWMRQHLADYAWMRRYWAAMSWMSEHWSGMSWMHTRIIMGSSPADMIGG